jgi:hypothetical protein
MTTAIGWGRVAELFSDAADNGMLRLDNPGSETGR